MGEYTNYKGPKNSLNKVAREKPQKVASGSEMKQNGITKFLGAFLADDIGNIKDYIIYDVIVPTVKNAIEDTVNNVVRMLLRGENAPSNRSGNASNRSTPSYATYYHSGGSRVTTTGSPAGRGYPVKSIVFNTRPEAVDVLSGMEDILEKYGTVSVNDYYELAGIDDDSANFTACDNGWTSLRNASVSATREGYVIKLPVAGSINN